MIYMNLSNALELPLGSFFIAALDWAGFLRYRE